MDNNSNFNELAIKTTKFAQSNITLLVLVLLIIIASVISPFFLSATNIFNICRQSSINGFMALGLTLVIITGGIDLSIAGILALTNVFGAMYINQFGLFVTTLLCMGIGALAGLANGLIITKTKMEPFICTLGMSSVTTGLAFMICQGRTVIFNVPSNLRLLANGNIGPVPTPVILMLIVYTIIGFVMKKTVFGRWVYSIGGNKETSRLAGINVSLVHTLVYVLSGCFAGLAGIFLLSRIGVGDPVSGTGLMMVVISVVIIGGNNFQGGRGGLSLTIIGLLIMGIISNILVLLGVSIFAQEMVRGLVILIAVILSMWKYSKK